MSALQRVRRARAALLAAVAGASVLWAAVIAAAIVLVVGVGDLVYPLPLGARRLAVPAALVAALAAFATVIWRGRHARSLGRVALFLEERLPALQYSLATAIQPAGGTSPAYARALEHAVDRVPARGALRAPLTRGLGVPAAALALAAAALVAIPNGTLARVLTPRPGDILARPVTAAPLGNRLTPIVARVTPPSYARREARTIDDPSAVAALVGSRIEILGRGASADAGDSLAASLAAGDAAEGLALDVTVNGDEWRVPVEMPARPAVVRLGDRGFDRLLVLEPVADEPPTVTLVAPPRDTILAQGKGTLALRAEATDDIGLGRAEFEVLLTSGSGERFETKTTIVGRTRLGGARERSVRAEVRLDTMGLKAGDVLHLRAIAWDENDVTGPGKGESETRTIRIYDPRAQQNVNITPARAAALDTSILSQRMLIIRAESLVAERPKLAQQQFTRRSLSLGVRQGDLRRRVESIVHDLENVEGVGFVGETPTSKILREAGVAMGEAETELSIARPDTALPHMRQALKLLERVRDANRYWLRGLLTTEPIEVDRVRLTGTDDADPGERDPREAERDARQALLARLDRAVALLDDDRDAAADSLRLVLVAALTDAKDVAAPLGEAVDAMRRRADPMPPLVQARRRLERRTDAAGSLSGWVGGSLP